jgi:alpha-tubulin suppressor-like RCC1 family protein
MTEEYIANPGKDVSTDSAPEIKCLHAVGFGSNYFHQFGDKATSLESSFDAQHGKGDSHNIIGPPNAFLLSLQTTKDVLASQNNERKGNVELVKKPKRLISIPKRIRSLMRRRKRNRKQQNKHDNIEIGNVVYSTTRAGLSYESHPSKRTQSNNDFLLNMKMSAGFTHSAFIVNRDLYLTGTLHGHLYRHPTIQRPRIPLKCIQISCGKRHVLALFENKETMSQGSGYFGQLGHGFNKVYCEDMTPIDRLSAKHLPKNGEVVHVEAGGMHSAAIVTTDVTSWHNNKKNVDTTIMRWGTNKYGQCCCENRDDHNVNVITFPAKMTDVWDCDTGKKVSFVALSLGKHHTIGLSNHGHVYTWGISNVCGHSHNDLKKSSMRKSALKSNRNSGISSPKRVEALRNINIIKVCTGDAHMLALSESGRVFSFGSNSFGQLGMGHKMHMLNPRSVRDLQFDLCIRDDGPAKEEISRAAERGSDEHSTTSNSCSDNMLPSLFDLSATISNIHYPSTPQKTASKRQRIVSTQKSITTTIPPYITSIHAAGSYSAALSSTGDLYTWGCGEGCQLGHPFNENLPTVESGPPQTDQRIRDSKSFDSRLNVLIPRRVECFRRYGLKVESLSTSDHYLIAICSKLDEHELKDENAYMMGRTLFEHELENISKGGLKRIRVVTKPTTSRS